MTTSSIRTFEDTHKVEIVNPAILKSLRLVDTIMQVFVEPSARLAEKELIREMLLLSIDEILEQFENTKTLNFSKISTFSCIRLTNSRHKLDYVTGIILKILNGEAVPIQYPSEFTNTISITLIQTKINIILSNLTPKEKAKLHPKHDKMLRKIEDLRLANDVLMLIQEVLENPEKENIETLNKIIEIINNNNLEREKLDLSSFKG